MGGGGGEPSSSDPEQKIEGGRPEVAGSVDIKVTTPGRMAAGIHAVGIHHARVHMGRR